MRFAHQPGSRASTDGDKGGTSAANERKAAVQRPLGSAPLSTIEQQEVVELHQRLKPVQVEREILAKAMVW